MLTALRAATAGRAATVGSLHALDAFIAELQAMAAEERRRFDERDELVPSPSARMLVELDRA